MQPPPLQAPSEICARQGWVMKRPTRQANRPWRDASIQRRWVESRGLIVKYFVDAPPDRAPTAKARAEFNLLDVTLLRPTADKGAPLTAVDMRVGKHVLTVDFQTSDERKAWLRIWVNGVPPSALPDEVRQKFTDHAVAAEMTRLQGGRKASYPRALPIPESGLTVSKVGWLDISRDLQRDSVRDSQRHSGVWSGRATSSSVPIYVQAEGYLLHWFPRRPNAGAKPQRTLDLRRMVSLSREGNTSIELRFEDASHAFRAASEEEATEWLVYIASIAPAGVLSSELHAWRDGGIVKRLDAAYSQQEMPLSLVESIASSLKRGRSLGAQPLQAELNRGIGTRTASSTRGVSATVHPGDEPSSSAVEHGGGGPLAVLAAVADRSIRLSAESQASVGLEVDEAGEASLTALSAAPPPTHSAANLTNRSTNENEVEELESSDGNPTREMRGEEMEVEVVDFDEAPPVAAQRVGSEPMVSEDADRGNAREGDSHSGKARRESLLGLLDDIGKDWATSGSSPPTPLKQSSTRSLAVFDAKGLEAKAVVRLQASQRGIAARRMTTVARTEHQLAKARAEAARAEVVGAEGVRAEEAGVKAAGAEEAGAKAAGAQAAGAKTPPRDKRQVI